MDESEHLFLLSVICSSKQKAADMPFADPMEAVNAINKLLIIFVLAFQTLQGNFLHVINIYPDSLRLTSSNSRGNDVN